MTTIAEDLKRALRNLTIATVVVYLVIIGAGLLALHDRDVQRGELRKVIGRTEDIALTANVALCALRHDLELRVEESVQFLEENPDGIPGISEETVAQSIANQRATIAALSGLSCSVEGG